MEQFVEKLTKVNDAVYDFVWVKIGIVLLLSVGVYFTIVTKFFQLSHIGHWFKHTIGSVFKKNSDSTHKTDKKTISQFQALCTALAATVGTGNVVGVSLAICAGGPGAVFWMWVAAFFGMMTKFSEITLGIYFRRKNANGEWSGGSMYILQDGLGSIKYCKYIGKILAILFAVFTIFASFGIGNMGQVNNIVTNLNSAVFSGVEPIMIGSISLIPLLIGIVIMIIAGVIILGGITRIAAVAERVVPVLAIAYCLGSITLFVLNINMIDDIFSSIFKFAFGIKAVGGAAAGIIVRDVITQGCKRGMFSNEAGLGSSVMVHSSANVKEPVRQGMWGIFEVFFDTFVICTMTAVVVLSSGYIDLETGFALEGINESTLVAQAFGNVFGKFGEVFVSIAILLFAFTTIIGWSQYGSKSVEYLFGVKGTKVYKLFFMLLVIPGAVMTSTLAWDLSDTFNGLMMIPNLIGVVTLSPLVVKLTRNYVARNIKGHKKEPMLSYDKDLERELAEKLND